MKAFWKNRLQKVLSLSPWAAALEALGLRKKPVAVEPIAPATILRPRRWSERYPSDTAVKPKRKTPSKKPAPPKTRFLGRKKRKKPVRVENVK